MDQPVDETVMDVPRLPDNYGEGGSRGKHLEGRRCCGAYRRLQHDRYGNQFYEVTSQQGQLVLNIYAVSSPRWFDEVTVPQFSLRGEEGLLQPLSAPETQTKNVELTGLLTAPRTLEVSTVVIQASTLRTLDVSKVPTRQ